jgi:hypothetical protein
LKLLRIVLIVLGFFVNSFAILRVGGLCSVLRDSFAINHAGAIQWLDGTINFIFFGTACLVVAALLPRKWNVYLEK